MNDDFDPHAGYEPDPALVWHSAGCRCALHARRRFHAVLLAGGAAVALPGAAGAQVAVPDRSRLSEFVPADEIEAAAAQQYRQMMQEARQKRALAPDDHPQLVRLRTIAERIVPHVMAPNLKSTPRAREWKWEINLVGSQQVNAFCMPGGKIAFFYGLLDKLKLTDEECAMVMGHEIAHALREHARERIGKNAATSGVIELGAALLGLGSGGRYLAGLGGQLLSLRFSRDDESEADKVGLDLAARAGYDPRAGLTLWEKMGQASRGAPPQWLSTHPPGPARIQQIQATLPDVQPLYASAPKPQRKFGPPA